jgi:hypothetical protein
MGATHPHRSTAQFCFKIWAEDSEKKKLNSINLKYVNIHVCLPDMEQCFVGLKIKV